MELYTNSKKYKFFKTELKYLGFIIDKNDLAFVNAQLKTVTEPGDFEIMIGDLKTKFTWNN